MERAILRPMGGNTYRVSYEQSNGGIAVNFGKELADSQVLEKKGEIEKACNLRYEAFQQLMELIPDSTDVELDWEDEYSRDAMLLISFSAIDHFLVGDFEMCAAMLEMLLELDPEDHLDASKRLAYVYVALEEYELFDEIINDVSDKYPDKEILISWCEYRRNGRIPEGDLRWFRNTFKVYYDEFISKDHPVDENYLQDIGQERPSREALARELWLQTEHLWTIFPGFIDTLRDKQ